MLPTSLSQLPPPILMPCSTLLPVIPLQLNAPLKEIFHEKISYVLAQCLSQWDGKKIDDESAQTSPRITQKG